MKNFFSIKSIAYLGILLLILVLMSLYSLGLLGAKTSDESIGDSLGSALPTTESITISSTVESATVPVDKEVLQNFSGYFIDQDCFIAYENPWEDNKDCLLMESCAASGYGIAIKKNDGNYQFYYFDGNFAPNKSAGQIEAAKLINDTTKTDHIYIEVTGTLSKSSKIGTDAKSYEVINVSTMAQASAPPAE